MPEQINTEAFKQRLLVLIGDSSVNSFASKCDVPESSIRNYIACKSLPKIDILVKIAKACNVDLSWLATGEKASSTQNADYLKDTNKINIKEYGVAASCGGGCFINDESIVDSMYLDENFIRVELKAEPKSLVLINYSGESMPKSLGESGKAFVDLSKNIVTGKGVYLIRLENTLMIKNVQKLPGKFEVSSENNDFKSFEINYSEIDMFNFKILGKIVGVIRKI